jgi:hypothetical protein
MGPFLPGAGAGAVVCGWGCSDLNCSCSLSCAEAVLWKLLSKLRCLFIEAKSLSPKSGRNVVRLFVRSSAVYPGTPWIHYSRSLRLFLLFSDTQLFITAVTS